MYKPYPLTQFHDCVALGNLPYTVPWLTLKYGTLVYLFMFNWCIWQRPRKLQHVTWNSPVWLYVSHCPTSKRQNSLQRTTRHVLLIRMLLINHHQHHHIILNEKSNDDNDRHHHQHHEPHQRQEQLCAIPHPSIYSIIVHHSLNSIWCPSSITHHPSPHHHPIAQAQRQPWPPSRCSPHDQNFRNVIQYNVQGKKSDLSDTRTVLQCSRYFLSIHVLSMFETCSPQPGRCSMPKTAHQLILIRDKIRHPLWQICWLG